MPATGGGQAEWRIISAANDSVTQTERGELTAAVPLARQRRVVAMVPDEFLLITEVSIKARNRQQLAKAVPYALEDELADDIDNLHFSIGESLGDNRHTVAVIEHARMQELLQELSVAGINAQSIVPESLMLPWQPDTWTLLIESQRAVLRTDDFHGLAIETDNLQLALEQQLSECEQPPVSIKVYDCSATSGPQLQLPVTLTLATDDCSAMDVLTLGHTGKAAMNLLQGTYLSRSPVSKLLKPWRVAAVLLGIWLSVMIAVKVMDVRQLSQQHENLRAGDGNNFITLLDTGAQAIAKAENTQINNLGFRDGRLEIKLQASDLESLETIKRQIEKAGFTASIQSAETRGDNVSARLLIHGGKG